MSNFIKLHVRIEKITNILTLYKNNISFVSSYLDKSTFANFQKPSFVITRVSIFFLLVLPKNGTPQQAKYKRLKEQVRTFQSSYFASSVCPVRYHDFFLPIPFAGKFPNWRFSPDGEENRPWTQ